MSKRFLKSNSESSFIHLTSDIKDLNLLIEIYKKQAKKYYEERNQIAAKVVVASSSDLLSKDEAEKEKRKQEIIPADVNNVVIHKNYQFDLFALEFPIFALKLKKKATKATLYK